MTLESLLLERIGPSTHVALVGREPLAHTDLGALAGPGATFHLFTGDLDDLHVSLAAHGPYDLVVDVCAGGGAQARFKRQLHHLRRGGELLMQLPTGRQNPSRERLVRLVEQLRALQASGHVVAPQARRDSRPSATRDLHGLAAAVASLTFHQDVLIASSAVDALAVLRETQMDTVLALHPGLGKVLHVEAGVRWGRVAPWRSTWEFEVTQQQMDCPSLTLRSYTNVICAPRMIAFRDGVALTASFRRPTQVRPLSPPLVDWNEGHVLRPDVNPEAVDGTWFYLDNVFPGHFGHVLTEQVSLTWAWERAFALHPEVRVLMMRGDHPVPEWQFRVLEAAGIPREMIVTFDRPVLVDRLLTATPAYAIASYAHPVMKSVYERIGRALAGPKTETERLFLTRRSEKRQCRNSGEIEDLFRDHGFTVVAPEEHTLEAQVAMARSASVIGGFGGSGIFHMALTDGPIRVFALGSQTYPMYNEKFMAALRGHDLTLVRGVSEVPSETYTPRSFRSAFTIDLEREGRTLREALEGL